MAGQSTSPIGRSPLDRYRDVLRPGLRLGTRGCRQAYMASIARLSRRSGYKSARSVLGPGGCHPPWGRASAHPRALGSPATAPRGRAPRCVLTRHMAPNVFTTVPTRKLLPVRPGLVAPSLHAEPHHVDRLAWNAALRFLGSHRVLPGIGIIAGGKRRKCGDRSRKFGAGRRAQARLLASPLHRTPVAQGSMPQLGLRLATMVRQPGPFWKAENHASRLRGDIAGLSRDQTVVHRRTLRWNASPIPFVSVRRLEIENVLLRAETKGLFAGQRRHEAGMPTTTLADLEKTLAMEIVRRLREGNRDTLRQGTAQDYAALEARRSRLRMDAIWGKLLDLERLLEAGPVLGR